MVCYAICYGGRLGKRIFGESRVNQIHKLVNRQPRNCANCKKVGTNPECGLESTNVQRNEPGGRHFRKTIFHEKCGIEHLSEASF